MTSTYAGWEHIFLYIENQPDMGGQPITDVTIATKIEENAAIPASAYQVPAGIEVRDGD
jgi:hypothetical protein